MSPACFPGLANSDGAVGFQIIDTTALTNGLHTISWIATDSEGQSEGLGSRFFRVLNNAGAGLTMAATASVPVLDAAAVSTLPVDRRPVRSTCAAAGVRTQPGHNRARTAPAARLCGERKSIGSSSASVARAGEISTGFMRTGESLQPLPAGSRLNGQTGDFVWAPGAGFVGPYNLVFVRAANGRAICPPRGSDHSQREGRGTLARK